MLWALFVYLKIGPVTMYNNLDDQANVIGGLIDILEFWNWNILNVCLFVFRLVQVVAFPILPEVS